MLTHKNEGNMEDHNKQSSFHEQILFERHKTIFSMYIASAQTTIEFSKMALRGSFTLNSIFLIPTILAKNSFFLHYIGIYFFVGAFLSVIASAMAYLIQNFELKKLEERIFSPTIIQNPVPVIKGVGRRVYFHIIEWILVALSFISCATGIYKIYSMATSELIRV